MTQHPERHRSRRKAYRTRRLLFGIAGALALVLVAGVGIVVYKALDLSNGIHRSSFAMPTSSSSPVPQNTGESNLLIMGLDSRVDQNGNPLPREMYDAIHAGDESDGGYNTNVLIFIHIPPAGGKATGLSIPRDDYAPLAGNPDGVSKSKIKEAYGLALDQKQRQLRNQGVPAAEAYQQARAFARQTEIQTVSDFLGGVRIDHFVEVTMAAFYKVAKAVQPITVCLNQATEDRYSGADFPAGMQEINASQAMSFVRQRRDTGPSDLELTDLDRTRRQQAFMVALAYQLRKTQTFANFGTMQALIDTAKQYVALDQNFDLLSLAQQAQRLAGGNITFQTLPIEGYSTIDGKDVNIVDPDKIHAMVANLLNSPTTGHGKVPAEPTASAPTSTTVPSNTYTDSQSPLGSGEIPCVN